MSRTLGGILEAVEGTESSVAKLEGRMRKLETAVKDVRTRH